ncbi:arsenite methyltransferase [Anaerolineae bacterium CFX7]|nr:arsenite methyltransferase [Anaerolineae bacterium CFX7]
MPTILATDIKARVSERYGAIAERHLAQLPVAGCCGSSDCCGDAATDMRAALTLYTPQEIRDLPPELLSATLGCGNPTALAALQPGETVLDLGSGAGLDCFLAARQVGPTGRVIGVDMTDSMLELAQRNRAQMGFANVEFRKGEIEKLPVAAATVDVIISNCVINLSADKDAVLREAFRVLKPGGRLAVSDMVTRGEIPPEFRAALDLWAGCLAGALDENDYARRLRAAGFVDVQLVDPAALRGAEIKAWAQDQTESAGERADAAWQRALADKIYSAKISAVKPLA